MKTFEQQVNLLRNAMQEEHWLYSNALAWIERNYDCTVDPANFRFAEAREDYCAGVPLADKELENIVRTVRSHVTLVDALHDSLVAQVMLRDEVDESTARNVVAKLVSKQPDDDRPF